MTLVVMGSGFSVVSEDCPRDEHGNGGNIKSIVGLTPSE